MPLRQPAGTNLHATDIVATAVSCATAEAVASDAIANIGYDGVPKTYVVYGLLCRSGNPTGPLDGPRYDTWTCKSGDKTITFLVGGGISPTLLGAPRVASVAGGAPSGPAGFGFTITQTAGCPAVAPHQFEELHFAVYDAAGQEVDQRYSFAGDTSASYLGGGVLSNGSWPMTTYHMLTQSNWGPTTDQQADLPAGRYTLKLWCLRFSGGNSTQFNYQNTAFTVTGPSARPTVGATMAHIGDTFPISSGTVKCPTGSDSVAVFGDPVAGIPSQGNATVNPDGSWEIDNLPTWSFKAGTAYVTAECFFNFATNDERINFQYGAAEVAFS